MVGKSCWLNLRGANGNGRESKTSLDQFWRTRKVSNTTSSLVFDAGRSVMMFLFSRGGQRNSESIWRWMKDNMESIFVHRSWSSRCRQLEIGGWAVNLWERTSNEDYKPSDEEGKKSSPNYRRKIGCSFLVSILHENLVGPRFQPKRVSPIRKDLQDYTSAAL